MMADAVAQEVLVWTDAPRVPLVRDVLGRMTDLRVLSVGGSRRAEVAELAEAFGAAAGDDLRRMVLDTPGSYLLLASPSGVARDDLAHALKLGIDVLSIEPLALQADQVIAPSGETASTGRLFQAPLLRFSPAYLAAAEPEQALGAVRSVSVTAIGPQASGSLFARLADAMDMLVHLAGIPDELYATLTGPLTEPPDDLRGMTGYVTAACTIADRAAATVTASDRSTAFCRRLLAVGETGLLDLDDLTYRLHCDPAAEAAVEADAAAAPPPGPAEPIPTSPADLIARQWRWLMARRHVRPTADRRAIIACCEAALLSARTGQPESPHKLLRLHA